ncbi:MAG: orotate phosphoribosyltransferase [Myxococcota bacterium]
MTIPHEPLAKLLIEYSYLEADEEIFRLASGQRSRFYFDCQRTTCRAEAMPLVGRAFLEAFRRSGEWPEAAGGRTRGADPIAQSIAYASLECGPPVHAFSVRKEPKDHGLGRWVEGGVQRGARVAVVEDVVTSGGSTLAAIERCQAEGLQIVQVVALVDREQGGVANIRSRVPDIPVRAIFTRSQLDSLRDGSP